MTSLLLAGPLVIRCLGTGHLIFRAESRIVTAPSTVLSLPLSIQRISRVSIIQSILAMMDMYGSLGWTESCAQQVGARRQFLEMTFLGPIYSEVCLRLRMAGFIQIAI